MEATSVQSRTQQRRDGRIVFSPPSGRLDGLCLDALWTRNHGGHSVRRAAELAYQTAELTLSVSFDSTSPQHFYCSRQLLTSKGQATNCALPSSTRLRKRH